MNRPLFLCALVILSLSAATQATSANTDASGDRPAQLDLRLHLNVEGLEQAGGALEQFAHRLHIQLEELGCVNTP